MVADCAARVCVDFRARLTPKPWRMDMVRIQPGGVWPVKPEQLPMRSDWIRRYTEASQGYASCRYLQSIGEGRSARICEAVREVHDTACQADSALPLA
ncbi:MAG: hypothetical protein AAF004_15745 [Pseudomonadota bacterium]